MRRSNLKRLTRGAATVEMSIVAIILVPTIMYTVFLEDLLFYKLEQYEDASSPAWDYLSLDFNGRKESGGKTTEKEAVPGADISGGSNHYKGWDNGAYARLTYCDHTSLYNSYDSSYECDDNHHNGAVTAAHQCWMVAEGKQIGCNLSKDDYLSSGLDGLSTFNDTYNKGGVYTCGARLGVMNYFLPNKFWTWSAKRNEGKKEYNVFTKARIKKGSDNRTDDNVHGSYTDPGVDPTNGTGNIVLAPQEFAVLHDPWAANYPDETDGDTEYKGTEEGKNGRFLERMDVYYQAFNSNTQQAKAFGDAAVGQQLITQQALTDGSGDDPTTPVLAWKKENTRTVQEHTASGWEDQRQRDSYGSRKETYFGWAPDEG